MGYVKKYPDWNGWPRNRAAVIAEIGINHGGDENLAWEMIRSAHKNGADFVKLQSFVMEDFLHPSIEYFSGMKLLELSLDRQKSLFGKAAEDGIRLITTPFDFASVDMAEEFDPPAHKIASMDNDNIPLIRYVAEKGRPLLLSCGMADIADIEKAVSVIRDTGNDKLVLLQCVSDYPTKPEHLNLSMIGLLRETFGCPVGLSDHSVGITGSQIALSLGAVVIEKHFTTDRGLAKKIPNADHSISIEPPELKTLSEFCRSVKVMMGDAPRRLTETETAGRDKFKRGIYAKRNIKAGETLNLGNSSFLRPVKGIRAGQWDLVDGRKVTRDIQKNSPIVSSDIEE
ncbi:MAG: NeuB family protein [bacterium]|nr:MAG: NeuB family protein [bacterium]